MDAKERGTGPDVKAFLICDAILRDGLSGKLTLYGLFTNIWSHSFPCQHKRMHVYVSLTDGRTKAPAKLELVQERTQKVIFTAKGEVDLRDALATCDLDFELQNMLFPEPDTYVFHFYCEDEIIASRKFHVQEAQEEAS